ncbi:peptidoglycan DD-metalloendopeptidase family protein [Asticcacaulis endophyticus]|nr:peptidoglycan DD-metalloendopeptidase family protein [Asticcacaulis endophyticus]
MSKKSFGRLRDVLEQTFPERHLYIRSNGETRGYVLSSGKQFGFTVLASVAVTWLAISTGAVMFIALSESASERQISLMKAQSERWVADRQARLDSATKQLTQASGSLDELASTVEKRHGALIHILKDFKNVPGASATLSPAPVDEALPPIERIYAVRAEQERMVGKAENFAKSRAERLRLAFRLAGLNPAAYAQGGSNANPLLEAKDSKELAQYLDVDEGFASRIRNAAINLNDMRGLQKSSETLPFNRPSYNVRTTSGFGVRFDPINGRPRSHLGLDFAGPYLTPIYSTAPGIVSFSGVRSGYGNAVEIDHGNGFKTRYAHMQSMSVRAGQRVAVGQRLGAMGSTGRSTGVHLHYEVWLNGRPQNPARFVKAGDYVQQN